MLAVGAGSVDQRVAFPVAGKQACLCARTIRLKGFDCPFCHLLIHYVREKNAGD